MKKIAQFIFAVCVVFGLTAANKKTTTIFMIGDSTMANKDISHDRKERGWGMALQCFFDDDIRVDNHAVNGRSSLSFINEGRWDTVVSRIKPGDYVVIQFGHNDEKPKADRHTEPGSTFDANLAKFVRETREKGGVPILMNAVVRRNFAKVAPKNDDDEALRNTTFKDAKGLVEGDSLVDTHGLYIVAPRNVAQQLKVHFVDANRITHNLEQGLGTVASRKLHMWFLPGEEPSVPQGRQDNTHYNVYGAHVVARLLADAMSQEIPQLERHRVDADWTVDCKGRGDFMKLEEAVDAALASKKASCVIQILGGQWKRPQLGTDTHIRFVLREGAQWK